MVQSVGILLTPKLVGKIELLSVHSPSTLVRELYHLSVKWKGPLKHSSSLKLSARDAFDDMIGQNPPGLCHLIVFRYVMLGIPEYERHRSSGDVDPRHSELLPKVSDLLAVFKTIIAQGNAQMSMRDRARLAMVYVGHMMSHERFLKSLTARDFEVIWRNRCFVVPPSYILTALDRYGGKASAKTLRKIAQWSVENPKESESLDLFATCMKELGLRNGTGRDLVSDQWIQTLWENMASLQMPFFAGDWSRGLFGMYVRRLFMVWPAFFKNRNLPTINPTSENLFASWVLDNMQVFDLILPDSASDAGHKVADNILEGIGQDAYKARGLLAVCDFVLSMLCYERLPLDATAEAAFQRLITGALDVRMKHEDMRNTHRISHLIERCFHHATCLFIRAHNPDTILDGFNAGAPIRFMVYSVILKELHRYRDRDYWKNMYENVRSLEYITDLFYKHRDWDRENNIVFITIPSRVTKLVILDIVQILRALSYLLFDVPFEHSVVDIDIYEHLDVADYAGFMNFWIHTAKFNGPKVEVIIPEWIDSIV